MFGRKMAATGLAVLALSTASACSRGGEAADRLQRACEAYVQLNAAFFSLPEDDGSSAETAKQAETFGARVVPLADRVAAGMPSDLRTTGQRFAKAIRSVRSEKSFDAVDSDAFFSDSVRISSHLGSNCGFPGGDVDALDHGFAGLPSALPAGRPIALNVTNRGSEAHALSILRARGGAPITLPEVLATPRDELLQRFELVSAVSLETPGQQASLITVLDPGTYVVGCFLAEDGKPDGRTHAHTGMIATLVAG